MAAPRRTADVLFRRDMVGPSLAHMAASATGLLLLEKLCLERLVPPLVPYIEATSATCGRTAFLFVSACLVSVTGFWGAGTLFALPALCDSRRWKIQADRCLDPRALLRALPLVVLNFVLGILVAPAVLAALLPERAFAYSALPDTVTLFRDIVVWLAVEEVTFFYVHRWLHTRRMYQAVHKLHHTWTSPISFTAIYCHPAEHLLNNIGPMLLGPILCGSHVAAVQVFVFASFVHTTAVHSGYWFCDDNGMHDEHHARFTVNYGVMGLMDSLYGTYRLPAGAVGSEAQAEGAPKRE